MSLLRERHRWRWHPSGYGCQSWTMINQLQDKELLSRVVGGDLIAMDVKYHLKCLTNLRNQYCSHMRQLQQATVNTDDIMNESRAVVELTSYTEMSVNARTLFFKLSELHSLYINHVEDLNINNKTRLKEQVLENISDAQVQHDGHSIILMFKEWMKDMIQDTLKKHKFSKDALILAHAANIVRK